MKALTSLCLVPYVGGLNWDSPSTPFAGSAGSSRGYGGRQATRTQIAGVNGGQDLDPDALSSGVACGALHEIPGHLENSYWT